VKQLPKQKRKVNQKARKILVQLALIENQMKKALMIKMEKQ
jgi:hypothetical protein